MNSSGRGGSQARSCGRKKEGSSFSPASLSPRYVHSAGNRSFYGWIIVVCTFVILCVAYGIQYTFGIFMPAIAADTGWDRATLSLPYSLYIFVYCALGAVTGPSTDRWGPRVVLIIGGGLLGSGLLLMSYLQALWQLYVFLGLIAAAGMSAAFVPCNATVVRWFSRRRGLALSITSSGASFGNFLFPPLTATLISAYGWRSTYLLLGLLATVLICLCAAFVVRDPEKMGLYPDGDLVGESSVAGEAADNMAGSEEWTLASVKHTSAFWLLTVIYTVLWLVAFIALVHLVPFALDLGISPLRAAMTISVIGIAGFVGQLSIGPISDRLSRTTALGLCLVLQTCSFLGFGFSTGPASLYPLAALFGFSSGGSTTLLPAIVGDFFGRLTVGATLGLIVSVAGSISALGPVLAGSIYRATGHYRVVFLLSAAFILGGLFLLLLLKKPVPTHLRGKR